MSHDAMLWALHAAPLVTTAEVALVIALGERAGPDGCGAFPSRSWLADRTKLDPKVVQRNLAELHRRGVIIEGDPALTAYIRADRRPQVWDLAIPAEWYSAERLQKVNQDRVQNGLEPLTRTNRPALSAAPEKVRRSDIGKPRAKRGSEAEETDNTNKEPVDNQLRGDSQSPREPLRGDSQSPGEGSPGDCESRTGGSQSRTGGLRVPRTY